MCAELRVQVVPGAPAVRARLAEGRSAIIRYGIETPGAVVPAASLSIEGCVVSAASELGSIRDELSLAGDGALEIHRRWAPRKSSPMRLVCAVELEGAFPRWIVPSVMYDGNGEGKGKYPRGGLEVGWSFREDRCSIPSCAILAGSSGSWTFFTRAARAEEELSSIRSRQGNGFVELAIGTPLEEAPYTYREKGWPLGGLHRPTRRWMRPAPGRVWERTFTLLPGGGPHVPYREVFAAARSRCRPEGLDLWASVDWGRYIALKTHWLRTHGFYRDGPVTGIIRVRRMAPLLQRYFGDFLGGSFLAKGMEAAVSFRRLGSECGDPELSRMSGEIASFLLGGELPSGLAYDDYSIHRKRFGGFFFPGRGLDRVVSTRCLGESAGEYALLSEEEGAGRDGRWMAHARRIADFFVARQLPDGNFGRFWSPEGELLDARGTNGAYILWLLAQCARITGEAGYLASARRAADYFISTSVEPQAFTFDTLDAECIDKEAGHALLRAFLLLHAATGEPRLAEAAREAASFCLGWQFAWDVPFAPSSPLAVLGFHTFGGTAVSVAHHHLDPYGMMIALDFLRLGRVLSEGRWQTYAHDLMGFCGQLVSTPERPLNLGRDFTGYQPEQYNHTDWDYQHHLLGGKGAYGAAASWVASSTLGAALDIRREFPAELPGSERLCLERLARSDPADERLP